MGQLGFLLCFLLPLAIAGKNNSFLSIPLAMLISMGLACTPGGQSKHRKNVYYGVIGFLLAIVVLVVLPRIAMGELSLGKYWFVFAGVLIFMQWLGVHENKEGQFYVPGEEGMKSLWTKVIVILFLGLMIGQYGSIKHQSRPISLAGISLKGIVMQSILFTLMDWPLLLKIGRDKISWKKECRNQFATWLGLYASFILLVKMFPYPFLERVKVPFLLLGRTGAMNDGAPIRLELVASAILWISLFFALWDGARNCMFPLLQCCKRKNRSFMAMILCFGIVFSLTGCSQELVEKELVLVGDSNTFCHKESYEKKEKKKVEFSHMKLLVVHDDNPEQIVDAMLRNREVPFQTKIVYSKEEISKKVSEDPEKISQQLRSTNFKDEVSFRQFINAYYDAKSLQMGEVQIKDSRISEIGRMWYRKGKSWK